MSLDGVLDCVAVHCLCSLCCRRRSLKKIWWCVASFVSTAYNDFKAVMLFAVYWIMRETRCLHMKILYWNTETEGANLCTNMSARLDLNKTERGKYKRVISISNISLLVLSIMRD